MSVAALAAATLVAGCASGSPKRPLAKIGMAAPVRISKDSALCPSGFAVAAYSAGHVFKPAYFPGRQPQKGVAACFISASAAENAGYKLASAPAGVERFGSELYVGPASATVVGLCRKAARELSLRIYCPTRLPTPWLEVGACPIKGCDVFKLDGDFLAAGSYQGVSLGQGHMNIWAGPDRLRAAYGLGCAGAVNSLGRTIFRGYPAEWFDCPNGSENDSGHILLEWHIGSDVYGVSAHGHTLLNRKLVVYVASHLRLERP